MSDVAVLSALAGAVVGGTASALGSYWVSKRQWSREIRTEIFRVLLPTVWQDGPDHRTAGIALGRVGTRRFGRRRALVAAMRTTPARFTIFCGGGRTGYRKRLPSMTRATPWRWVRTPRPRLNVSEFNCGASSATMTGFSRAG